MDKERRNVFEERLRQRHSIPTNGNEEDIKERIAKLLDEPITALDAAEIILGRRVGENERHIINLAISHLTVERKFEKLVAQRDHEDLVRKVFNNGKK